MDYIIWYKEGAEINSLKQYGEILYVSSVINLVCVKIDLNENLETLLEEDNNIEYFQLATKGEFTIEEVESLEDEELSGEDEDYYDLYESEPNCSLCGRYYCPCCGCDCWYDDDDEVESYLTE